MKKSILLGSILSLANCLYAQSDTIQNLDQVVISANKTAEKKRDIPNQVEIIPAAQIKRLSPQTTADALQNSGAVFVQKSQQGGGSPVLRGFEANKVLLVVDGVRMNNAIYRSGHLQNVITIDPAALDRIEVLYGAGSVIYGTDAIGGVVSLFTRNPRLSVANPLEFEVGSFARYNSANRGRTLHTHFNLGAKKWANYLAVTGNVFGDLRSGRNDLANHPGFGDRNVYVERINGRDSILQNSNPDLQKQSGYKQVDILNKFLYAPGGDFKHTLNLQYSNSGNVPRYDRLSEISNGKPRFAEWYYGPQLRLMGSYQLQWDSKKMLADFLRLTPAFQQIQESRYDRRFNNNNRNERVEDLWVASVNLDLYKNIARHELRYGAEYTNNQLKSVGTLRNVSTNEVKPLQSRYPNGRFTTSGVYASHRWEILGPKLILSDGLRYSLTRMDVTFDSRFFNLEDLRDVSQNSSSLNYNLGLTANLPGGFRAAAMLSSGFRAPNIDDAGKIFENANGSLTIPNANLKPEQVLHRELSLSQQFKQYAEIGTTFFLSSLSDAIAVRPGLYKGQNTLVYNGDTLNVVQNVNVSEARVWGISGYFALRLPKQIQIRGNVSYTEGRDLTAAVPLDHIPPLMARAVISWNPGKFNLESDVLLNGWKRIDDYSPSGEDNQQYATPEGMPAWQVWNFRASWQYNRFWRIQASVENILDLNYRAFASGINGAGRNFSLGVYWGM